MMVFKESYKDLARMESVIRECDLNWTIVAPPRLTDGPRTGHYRVTLNANVRYGLSISRADVAHDIVEDLNGAPPSPSFVFLAY